VGRYGVEVSGAQRLHAAARATDTRFTRTITLYPDSPSVGNAAGRLVRAESVTATLVYTYNHSGLRVGQSVDGNESTYAWDWATGVPELLSDGDARYLVGHDTLGWDAGAGWRYALPDALGSVRHATDSAGVVVAAREPVLSVAEGWTPYGVEVGDAQAGLGFTGEWFDAAVGLQYLRARWYHPGTGRFTQVDPWAGTLWQPQSLAYSYVYVSNNPVNNQDPSGLVDCSAWPIGLRQLCEKAETNDLDAITQIYNLIVLAGNLKGGDFQLASTMMSHYLNGNGADFELSSSWIKKLVNDPNILAKREELFDIFIENDVRPMASRTNFSVSSQTGSVPGQLR
jgi:RHS repeat-associated protein